MAIRVDDPRPPFVQLADELRQAIHDGRYGPGERLPSTRRLAEENGVAPMTVQSAMKVLLEEGIVVSQERRGVYVRPEADADAAAPLDVSRDADATASSPKTLDEALAVIAEMGERLDRMEAELAAARDPRPGGLPAPSPSIAVEPDIGPEP